MRRLALVLLVACGGSKQADAPRCVDALAKLAERRAADGDRTMLIGTCEQEKWTPVQRTCVAGAASTTAAVDCILGKLPPLPAPTPSDDVKKRVAAAKPAVSALVFGDRKNEAIAAVVAYGKALGIEVEVVDRYVDAERSRKYRVTKGGTLVLVREDQHKTIEFPVDGPQVRDRLAKLDGDVSAELTKLLRVKRKVYVTSGHGEITETTETERKTSKFMQQIELLNMTKAELAAADLAGDVPADATVVVTLRPRKAFSAEEQASLARYLDRGGALLLAYDPTGVASMGALDAKLGVKRATGHLVDDKNFLPQKQQLSDRRFVITSQFSAHASTTALSRSVNKGLVFLDGGALESVQSSAKKTVTIRSMPDSFLDLDGDFTLDDGKEKRDAYELAVAIEDKFRAVVLADTDVFADALIPSGSGRTVVAMIGGPLLVDVMRWLAGEEVFAGEIVADDPPRESEDDRERAKLTAAFRSLEKS